MAKTLLKSASSAASLPRWGAAGGTGGEGAGLDMADSRGATCRQRA
jgi:hypothetical protein